MVLVNGNRMDRRWRRWMQADTLLKTVLTSDERRGSWKMFPTSISHAN